MSLLGNVECTQATHASMRTAHRLRVTSCPPRGLDTRVDLLQRLPRGPLRRMPRRALPRGARRARGRMFHAARLEGRPPTFLVVPRELEIVVLSRHADCDVPDPRPGSRARTGARGARDRTK